MERQSLNVFRMRLLGAEVRPVAAGTCTLKDATSEAIRDWVTNVESTHYILGSVAGPHPYPMMVSPFPFVKLCMLVSVTMHAVNVQSEVCTVVPMQKRSMETVLLQQGLGHHQTAQLLLHRAA